METGFVSRNPHPRYPRNYGSGIGRILMSKETVEDFLMAGATEDELIEGIQLDSEEGIEAEE